MARKAKAKAKLEKAVKTVLDSTELDEKIIAEYNEHKSLYDLILCYIKCYGGYLLAVGAGCTFGVSLLWGTILLAAAGAWAYVTTCGCKLCKGGNSGCCKN
tara:strand:- start:1528 stop:1830 length:303 start_codon:yes stop_codon:yes gene_type:complete